MTLGHSAGGTASAEKLLSESKFSAQFGRRAATVPTLLHDKAMAADFLAVLDPPGKKFTFQVFGEAHRPLRAKCSQAPVGELVQAFASNGQRSSLGRLESITLKVSPSWANIRANTLAGVNSSG